MKDIILGCVADDFTGASDAASFLVKGGLKTLLVNGVPKINIKEEFDAIVIALKTRTQETKEALKETADAINWLKNQGARQLYIKYCSTFDSTKEGNIGPIVDMALELSGSQYTILSPALPVNGRVVKDGCLYVDGVLLSESYMKNHPLTPMWDSDIEKLMTPQSKYKCLKISRELMNHNSLKKCIEGFKDNDKFYIIPDFVEQEDAKVIVDLFYKLPLLTGSSGILEELAKKYKKNNNESHLVGVNSKAIILAGSCSVKTLSQIEHYIKNGGEAIKIDPIKLLEESENAKSIWEKIKNTGAEEILVYSSDNSANVERLQKYGKEKIAKLIEDTIATIAKFAVEDEYKRIVVAGGETSGAVSKKLGFENYIISDSVAPGVPIMIPYENEDIRLILKSGNFGQEDFFNRALEITKKE